MKEFVTILSVVTGVISIANMLLSVFGKSFLTKEILVLVTQRPAFARLLVIVILEVAFGYFFGWLTALCLHMQKKYIATQMLIVVILCVVSAWVSVFNVYDILLAPYSDSDLSKGMYPGIVVLAILVCYLLDAGFIAAHINGVIVQASALPEQTSLQTDKEDFSLISQLSLMVCFVIISIGRAWGT